MLYFRGVINVAQFSVLAIVKFRMTVSSENSSPTTMPGTHDKGNAAWQQSRQTRPATARTISTTR